MQQSYFVTLALLLATIAVAVLGSRDLAWLLLVLSGACGLLAIYHETKKGGKS